ncbi:MAG: histidine phosphatase family protein [Lachnospiraceae bacterium]|nr:histidine phosphatase family protein [Lachnospiraceae bacterium]MBQ7777128.1 histidine phosphatase family protein [Lachnospiraceae bacterium]
MKIYLIRHGETDQNKVKCLQGRTDIELNAYGRELAYKTAEGLKDVEFDIIFTSPLKRAKETAEIIRGERNIPILTEERIQEISFGAYEGLCYGKEHYSIPDADFMDFFDRPECYQTPPAGESFASVIARTGDFLRELAAKEEYQDRTILLSTHGCALKAVLANARNTPLKYFWGEGVHKNCAVSLIEVADGQMRVLEDGKLYY